MSRIVSRSAWRVPRFGSSTVRRDSSTSAADTAAQSKTDESWRRAISQGLPRGIDVPAAGYHGAMLLRPLRRAPMMLGGVGFQAGVDEARRKQVEAQRQAAARAPQPPAASPPDVVEQLKQLKALHDDGVLSPEEFAMAKRKVLGG